MALPPPVTRELVDRLDRVAAASSRCGLQAASRIDGNPASLSFSNCGETTLIRADKAPEQQQLNQILRLQSQSVEALDRAVDFFGAAEAKARARLTPSQLDAALGQRLALRGFAPVVASSVLYGLPSSIEASVAAGVELAASPPKEIDVFVHTWLQAAEVSEPSRELLVKLYRAWFLAPGYHRYLGRLDGEVAGVCTLFVDDGIGLVDYAATLVDKRGRGVQSGLAAYVAQRAMELGCELLAAETDFASRAQHTLERRGLRMAYSPWIFEGPQ